MGICSSSNATSVIEQARVSAIIDRDLAIERDEFRLKILLLGTGESGKSTILKQMRYVCATISHICTHFCRILHSTGFTHSERLQKRLAVYENMIFSMEILCTAMKELNIEYQQQSRQVCHISYDNSKNN